MDSRIIGELEWDSRSNNDFVEILYGDKEELEEKLIGSYIIGVSKNVIELSNEVKVKASSISSDGDASARANILEYKANKSLIITSINLSLEFISLFSPFFCFLPSFLLYHNRQSSVTIKNIPEWCPIF